eukprot:GHVS01065110.1.p1 GENE.GHVS01065110.1~~GHVS01065110.1.p1  ORF type:complete len:175 (+),score=40.21 GHVS01065110.1:1-525(+)
MDPMTLVPVDVIEVDAMAKRLIAAAKALQLKLTGATRRLQDALGGSDTDPSVDETSVESVDDMVPEKSEVEKRRSSEKTRFLGEERKARKVLQRVNGAEKKIFNRFDGEKALFSLIPIMKTPSEHEDPSSKLISKKWQGVRAMKKQKQDEKYIEEEGQQHHEEYIPIEQYYHHQ